jgi:hypothetical protein
LRAEISKPKKPGSKGGTISARGGFGTCAAKDEFMLNPAVIDSAKAQAASSNFWSDLLNNEELQHFGDLEKLLVGCEIIAALDAVDLLAA